MDKELKTIVDKMVEGSAKRAREFPDSGELAIPKGSLFALIDCGNSVLDVQVFFFDVSDDVYEDEQPVLDGFATKATVVQDVSSTDPMPFKKALAYLLELNDEKKLYFDGTKFEAE